MSNIAKAEIEADAVAELRDNGMPLVGVNLKTAERLTGIPSNDLLRAIVRREIDARWDNGRIILIWQSLEGYVFRLPPVETAQQTATPQSPDGVAAPSQQVGKPAALRPGRQRAPTPA